MTAHLHQISTCFLRAVSRDMKINKTGTLWNK